MALLHRWAIKLELHVRLHPVNFFQFCTLIWLVDLGGAGFIALMGAIVSSKNLLGGLIRRFDVKALRNMLAFMDQYPECRFESVEVEEVLSQDFLVRVGERSASMGRKRRGWLQRAEEWFQGQQLGEMAAQATRVFVVKPETDTPSPSSPTAFPLRLGGYIFLLDAPTSLRGPGRFIFLHELGHIAMAGNYYVLRAQTGYLPFLLVAVYAAGQLAPNILAVCVLVIYTLLGRMFLKTEWEVFSEMAGAHHESQADFFAFANLDEADRRSAASFLRQYPITDMKLAPAFEEVRRQFLAENISLIETGEDRLVHHHVSADTPFFVWIALGTTVLLAFFMRPQDHLSLVAEMVITGGTLAFHLVTVWCEHRLRQQIEARLETRRA